MRCPFLTLQEAFRQICIIPIHVIGLTRKICASKILRIFVFSSLFMKKKLDNVILYIYQISNISRKKTSMDKI